MKTGPIAPARVERLADGTPFSPVYGDVYHPSAGALEQARHVFLGGNGLPERWRGRDRFVVLETGFGLGNNFLATWDAWRHDAQACRQLHFVSIEQQPLSRDALAALPRDASLAPLAQALIAAWPPLTWNLHRLSFEQGRVQLLLAFGDAAAWLPELVARVDAFFLDGFAPARNPQMWQPRLFKAMGRMAAPAATAATWTAARAVREGLTSAGFEVQIAAGHGGKRDITLARYAPTFTPVRAPGRAGPAPERGGHAAIVGAGLAGCATACALAEQGWTSTLLDRHDAPAQEASGNPAGLFHGIVNAQDGAHARFNRAAALEAERLVRQALASGTVAGSHEGLLRLDTSGTDAAAMHALLQPLGLPEDYVQAVDPAEASRLSGLPLAHPAWFYPGGGWVKPGELARYLLHSAGSLTRFEGQRAVHALRRHGERWQLLDADGAMLEEADAVVLANGGDALRLLDSPAWPIEKIRGQISMLAPAEPAASPRIPIAGAGYLLPNVDGHTVFGATAQPGDDDPQCRDSDHVHNLAQLATLLGRPIDASVERLQGRVGWRWSSVDRLPIIGAVPDADAAARAERIDQPRLVPRVPGLFVFTALGSRGITWCGLGAQVLAALVAGAPLPIEASLFDAVDAARFVSRQGRRASRY
jgi:tRNA 5-methylaminomethyl-2-thiouridine biosynthesis bifunctional protein